MMEARFVAIAVLFCCLPVYGAMGPITDQPQDTGVAVDSFDQNDPPAAAIDTPKEPHAWAGNVLNQPMIESEGDLRDTGFCEPPVGLEEPVTCLVHADCNDLGKEGGYPETCGVNTSGLCDYPPLVACTTDDDCKVLGVGIGTGHCDRDGYCENQNFHACRLPLSATFPRVWEEGEWELDTNGCGFPNDNYNGGCNATSGPVFQAIECGDTICGTVMEEQYSGSQRRDTDWYQLVLTQPTRVTMHGTAEFDFVFGLARNHGNDNCAEYDYYFWGGHYAVPDACEKGTAEACIGVGTWWIAVVPQWNQLIPCMDYELAVECDAPCHIACCTGNNICEDIDEDTCEFTLYPSGFYGARVGDDCAAVPGICAWGCPGDVKTCNSYTQVDNSVNSDYMNPSPSCGTGFNIGTLWFNFVATHDSVRISTCNSLAPAWDSVFALYSGDCENTLAEISCAEDAPDCPDSHPDNWNSYLDNCSLIVGDTYYIQLGSWDAGAQGVYDLDITCPSPICAPAACCLSDGSCVTATPAECEALGGQHQGPGTFCMGDGDSNGIDDACELGACCPAAGGCINSAHDFCYEALGGVDFIPGAICPEAPGDPDPCAGACCKCVPNTPPPGCTWVCSESAGKPCRDTQGTWYEGEECGGPGGPAPWFGCPEEMICSTYEWHLPGPPWYPEFDYDQQQVYCQLPSEDAVEGATGAISDEDPWIAGVPPDQVLAQRAADDFVPLASGIEMVCWWGHYVDQDPDAVGPPVGMAPECNIADDLFTISYYMDDNACPGTLLAQYSEKDAPPTLTVVKTTAGWRTPLIQVGTNVGAPLVWEYEGTHASQAVTVDDCYWLEIVNDTGTTSCSWVWDPSPFLEGNGYSVQEFGLPGSTTEWDCTDLYDPEATTLNRFDLAWCLNVPNQPCDFCRELVSAKLEGEPICYFNYVDTYNAGCNLCDPPGSSCYTEAFTDIECGEYIKGTAGTYEGYPDCTTNSDCDPLEECIDGKCTGDTVNFRDTDWYKFSVTTTTSVQWCVYAEFPALTGIINTFATHNCPPNPGWAALAVKPMCLDQSCTQPQNLAEGVWYGYVATSAFVGAQCGSRGSEYEVCLNCNGLGCEPLPTECVALDVRSLKDHVGTEFKLNMGVSGGIEPRTGQITKLEIDLDSSASVIVTDTATVNCSAAWAGTATVTAIVGNTVTVTFSSSLPDQAYCVITLDCMTNDVCVRMCEGDMNRSGATNTTDAGAVKARFGATLVDGNCEWDFNHSGAINTTDAGAVKARFGKSVPLCP